MSLATFSDLATILTAVVAAGAWAQFQLERLQRRRRLERHLATRGTDHNPASIPELMADLGMSEQAIMDAAFHSKRIRRARRTEGGSGRTVAVELEYDREPPQRF